MDRLKEACGEYLVGVEVKEAGEGVLTYRTLHKRHHPKAPGPRPLGTFPSELEAVQALYDHLVASGLIQPINE